MLTASFWNTPPFRENHLETYVQDTWRLRTDITLSAGVRYGAEADMKSRLSSISIFQRVCQQVTARNGENIISRLI